MSESVAEPGVGRAGVPGLEGKKLLVTGGSSGIGQAIAVRFARHGSNLGQTRFVCGCPTLDADFREPWSSE